MTPPVSLGVSDEDIDFLPALPPPYYRLAKRYPLLGDLNEAVMMRDPFADNEVSRRSTQFAWRPHSRFGKR